MKPERILPDPIDSQLSRGQQVDLVHELPEWLPLPNN